MINDWIKTGIFAAIGVVLAIIAASVYYANLPDTDVVAQRVGQPFFEDFKDVDQAKEIRIATSSTNGSDQAISLEFANGLWRIPSHNNYPAEDSERLGNTTSLLLGLNRQAIVSRDSENHAKYKVEDPLNENSNPDNAGTRLTIWDGTKNILADMIIGKKVEVESDVRAIGRNDLDVKDQYYVRHPDESEIYQVSLTPDLSNDFSDWIKPELLQVESSNLQSIEFRNYEIKPEVMTIEGRQYGIYLKDNIDSRQIVRNDSDDQWTFKGINPQTEEPNATNIQSVVDAFTNMEIVDVRRKFEYDGELVLNPQLEIDKIHPQLMDVAQEDLKQHGFAVINADRTGDKFTIASTSGQGELNAGTQDGVRYVVYFGDEFVGSINNNENDNPSGGDESPATGDESETKPTTDDPATAPTLNRYVMIRVEFDQSLIGPPPTAPAPPNQPIQPPELAQPDSFNMQASDLPPIPSDAQRVSPRAIIAQDFANKIAAYQTAMQQYQTDKMEFDQEVQDYNDRIKTGKEKVAELNERFGSWFYVVNADKLKDLKFDRQSLVSTKAPDPNGLPPGQGLNTRPNLNFPPGLTNELIEGAANSNKENDEK